MMDRFAAPRVDLDGGDVDVEWRTGPSDRARQRPLRQDHVEPANRCAADSTRHHDGVHRDRRVRRLLDALPRHELRRRSPPSATAVARRAASNVRRWPKCNFRRSGKTGGNPLHRTPPPAYTHTGIPVGIPVSTAALPTSLTLSGVDHTVGSNLQSSHRTLPVHHHTFHQRQNSVHIQSRQRIHQKTVIAKSVNFNDRDCFVRMLYKNGDLPKVNDFN